MISMINTGDGDFQTDVNSLLIVMLLWMLFLLVPCTIGVHNSFVGRLNPLKQARYLGKSWVTCNTS